MRAPKAGTRLHDLVGVLLVLLDGIEFVLLVDARLPQSPLGVASSGVLGFSDELDLVGVGSYIERVITKWQGLLSGRLTEGDALFLDEPHHEPISKTTNDLENVNVDSHGHGTS